MLNFFCTLVFSEGLFFYRVIFRLWYCCCKFFYSSQKRFSTLAPIELLALSLSVAVSLSLYANILKVFYVFICLQMLFLAESLLLSDDAPIVVVIFCCCCLIWHNENDVLLFGVYMYVYAISKSVYVFVGSIYFGRGCIENPRLQNS